MSKASKVSPEIEDLQRILAASGQVRRRPPQRIADILSRLLTRRGYANLQAESDWSEVWRQAAGAQANDSRPGKITRGVLEVHVRNSAVLQELTFRKKGLLQALQRERPQLKIKDLKFRIGSFD